MDIATLMSVSWEKDTVREIMLHSQLYQTPKSDFKDELHIE